MKGIEIFFEDKENNNKVIEKIEQIESMYSLEKSSVLLNTKDKHDRSDSVEVHLVLKSKTKNELTFEWQEDADRLLIEKGVRAQKKELEVLRMSLHLESKFYDLELRYGEGFFDSSMYTFLKALELDKESFTFKILKEIFQYKPYEGKSYDDSQVEFKMIFMDIAFYINSNLHYNLIESQSILDLAISLYLDRRFYVTLGKEMGF